MNILAVGKRMGGRRSLGADASVTAATNMAIAGMGFCTGIVAARMLGPRGRGELAAIQTTPSFIALFALVGMPEALVYFSAQKPAQAGRYLVTAMGLSLAASVPCMAVAYLGMPLLLHAQGTNIVAAARWYLLIAPIWAVVAMMYHPLRGIGEFQAWNALRLCVPLLALCVLVLAYLTGLMTPAFVAFGNLTTYAIMVCPCIWLVRRLLHGPFQLDSEEVGPMLRYGLPCVMTGLPQMLNLRLDQILMATFLPPQKLGLYVVAVAWSGAVFPLLTSIGSTMLPSVAAARDYARASARMCDGVRTTALLAIATCMVVGGATPLAIPALFGARFRASILPALILVPAAGVLGVNFSLQEGIRGFGRPYLVLGAELCGLVVTALSLLLMLRPMGIVGAAFASVLGYSTVTVVLLISAKRITGATIISIVTPRIGDMRRGIMWIAATAREMTT